MKNHKYKQVVAITITWSIRKKDSAYPATQLLKLCSGQQLHLTKQYLTFKSIISVFMFVKCHDLNKRFPFLKAFPASYFDK